MKSFFKSLISFFKKKKKLSLGIYGPPNAGKSTLANLIVKEILGEEKDVFKTSNVEHETREIQEVKELELKRKGKTLKFNLIDTPGIATKIDFEDFVKKGMKKKPAQERAKEATKGVIESIKWMENLNSILVVLDATKNPYTQTNITLIGNLIAKSKKILIVANKSDLKNANVKKIKAVFPEHPIVLISAKTGKGMEELYKKLFEVF